MRRNLSRRGGMRRAGMFAELRLHLDGTLPPLATFHPHLPFSTVPVVFSACSWRALAESHPASVFKDTSTTHCYSSDIFIGWWWSVHLIPILFWNAGSAPRTGFLSLSSHQLAGSQPVPWTSTRAGLGPGQAGTAQQKALGHLLSVFAIKGKVSHSLQKNTGNAGKLRWKHSLKQSKDGYGEDHTLEQICFQLLPPSNSHILFCPIQFSSILLFLTPLWANILHTRFMQVQLLSMASLDGSVCVSVHQEMDGDAVLLAAIHLSHFCSEGKAAPSPHQSSVNSPTL